MAVRIPWIERRFNFDFPVELHREILERVRGTSARIEELVRNVPAEVATGSDGEGWTIQENIGHLLDLEPLAACRLDEFERGDATLSAADMTNKATHAARYNERPLESILGAFREARSEIVKRVEGRETAFFARTALHPRLNQPMRVVDLMYFFAEHDDYHLARISELLRTLRKP